MNIIRIPALETNYIWVIYNYRKECIIVDPGDAIKALTILKNLQLTLQSILLTHYHDDHINGINALIQHFPKIFIYGPTEPPDQYKNKIVSVSEGDDIMLLQKKFTVLDLPGHTPHHIGFYNAPRLFCGDTVFSAGCGKIYKNFEKKMYESFLKIKHLPHNTWLYSGHEYTLPNINFSAFILPKDQLIINYRKKIITLRQQNKPTIPTILNLELRINPFFRCHHLNIKKALNFFPEIGQEWKTFAMLRNKKTQFDQSNNSKK